MRLLTSDLMAFPKGLGGADVNVFLAAAFEQYQQALDGLGDDLGRALHPKRPQISLLCHAIIKALAAAIDPAGLDLAVPIIGEGLDAVREDLLHVARTNEQTVLKGQSLYRVRESGTQLGQRREMFHIPFALRHLAPECRYSLPGNPCLYLANSHYTCWTECRLPEIENCTLDKLSRIYTSRFELKPDTKLLDTCFPPWAVAIVMDNYEEDTVRLIPELANATPGQSPITANAEDRARYLSSYLAVWPLSLAISLHVPGESNGRKPEYIIPQVLMAWVQKSTEFAGIRYFSTRESPGNSNYDYPIDYAFPAKNSGPGDYCDFLRGIFRSTEPLDFAKIKDSDIAKHFTEEDFKAAEGKFRRYMIVYEKDGIRHLDHYYGTLYCNMEYVLDHLDVAPIEDH